MDAGVQRLLNDKLYDKRKIGALEYVGLHPSPLFGIKTYLVPPLSPLDWSAIFAI